MPVIFFPFSEDILEGPFKPLPRTAFIMLHSSPKISKVESDMDKITCECLESSRIPLIKAASLTGTKDYLEKIIQIIRGCGFGVAIFSESTPAPTLANIFFEVGLCSVLGKSVVLVKTAKAKLPSDLVRTELVTFKGRDERRLRRDLESSITSIIKLAEFYEKLGDSAMEAENVDMELAFERYKQAVLTADSKSAQQKIDKLLERLKNKDDSVDFLRASRSRLRSSISEFMKLLP